MMERPENMNKFGPLSAAEWDVDQISRTDSEGSKLATRRNLRKGDLWPFVDPFDPFELGRERHPRGTHDRHDPQPPVGDVEHPPDRPMPHIEDFAMSHLSETTTPPAPPLELEAAGWRSVLLETVGNSDRPPTERYFFTHSDAQTHLSTTFMYEHNLEQGWHAVVLATGNPMYQQRHYGGEQTTDSWSLVDEYLGRTGNVDMLRVQDNFGIWRWSPRRLEGGRVAINYSRWQSHYSDQEARRRWELEAMTDMSELPGLPELALRPDREHRNYTLTYLEPHTDTVWTGYYHNHNRGNGGRFQLQQLYSTNMPFARQEPVWTEYSRGGEVVAQYVMARNSSGRWYTERWGHWDQNHINFVYDNPPPVSQPETSPRDDP